LQNFSFEDNRIALETEGKKFCGNYQPTVLTFSPTQPDLEQRDENGLTPLLVAICSGLDTGNTQCIKALLDAGAKANTTDRNGRTPLMYATS
jgi:ankyrin repeat protein